MPNDYTYTPRPQYASSRKSKHEQQKMLKQTLIFAVAGVILVALFFSVILPGLIKLISGKSSTDTSQTASDALPPQVPEISAPVPATSSAHLNLNGFSEKNDTVVLQLNSQEVNRQTVQDDGKFSFAIDLPKGENHLTAYAIDKSGKKSDVSQDFVVLYNDTPPQITISEPQDKQQIQGKGNQNMTIKGTVDKNTRVTLNDRLIFTHDDGSFSTLQMLHTGDNTIDFKVTDQAGNITEKILTVNYHD